MDNIFHICQFISPFLWSDFLIDNEDFKIYILTKIRGIGKISYICLLVFTILNCFLAGSSGIYAGCVILGWSLGPGRAFLKPPPI